MFNFTFLYNCTSIYSTFFFATSVNIREGKKKEAGSKRAFKISPSSRWAQVVGATSQSRIRCLAYFYIAKNH